MQHILNKIVFVKRFSSRIIAFDPDDPTPTLYWSPEFSLFSDGKGNERHLWNLSARNDTVAMCNITNVRFVDCSASPKLH